jgi:hypothetical protein
MIGQLASCGSYNWTGGALDLEETDFFVLVANVDGGSCTGSGDTGCAAAKCTSSADVCSRSNTICATSTAGCSDRTGCQQAELTCQMSIQVAPPSRVIVVRAVDRICVQQDSYVVESYRPNPSYIDSMRCPAESGRALPAVGSSEACLLRGPTVPTAPSVS